MYTCTYIEFYIIDKMIHFRDENQIPINQWIFMMK